MPTIAMLKQDMESTKSLGDIVDVLKIAALMQFHAFQLKEWKPKQDFLNIAEDIFNVLVSKGLEHPFLFDRPTLPSLIVVITSDEGFLGDLNMLAINAALNIVKTSEDHVLCLGRRGARYLEDTDVSYKVFPGVSSEINTDELEPLKLYILNGYKKKFGRVYIIYPKFISLAVQKIDKVLLLPYQKSSQAKILRGFFIDEMLIEPAISHVLEMLIEIYLDFRLLDI
ncbi:MAG TPA: F0F1 ATP synthase subunit gamma, partial [Candidatus Omnitrophota bacterium]|nr:F0F1 ATP synthase subunit gamma [Candidatus Omnitrophota bacterium]